MNEEAIEFGNWIKNNWFIPTYEGDGWKLDLNHTEYMPTIDSIDRDSIFSTEELFELFSQGNGEF